MVSKESSIVFITLVNFTANKCTIWNMNINEKKITTWSLHSTSTASCNKMESLHVSKLFDRFNWNLRPRFLDLGDDISLNFERNASEISPCTFNSHFPPMILSWFRWNWSHFIYTQKVSPYMAQIMSSSSIHVILTCMKTTHHNKRITTTSLYLIIDTLLLDRPVLIDIQPLRTIITYIIKGKLNIQWWKH